MTQTPKTIPAEKSEDARQIRGERTRQALLEAAFDEIHQHGYRSASLNDILKAAGCTKGSLYHHFPDKHALGLAAIVDNIDRFMATNWLTPLADSNNPISTLLDILQRHVDGDVLCDVRLGCPLQNLSQEMSGLDEDFRTYLNGIHEQWRTAIADALRKGQNAGQVRKDISAEAAATMIIATHQGTVGLIKTAQSTDIGTSSFEAFYQYLNSLRATGNCTPGPKEGLAS
ncbi:TetR/AcrR family transcriptional regulator [Parvibaculaceae bacterium PLY_AMNH_Bact1]|nr:TetR/AcrR family transcriptional regulator [Parvibaculaceae bacterium PLY_AMNH_Bact1]